MNVPFQIFLSVIAVIYKVLLAKRKAWGWFIGIFSSLLASTYLILYTNLFILVCLEFSVCFAYLYGFYKQKTKKEKRAVDRLILVATIIAVTFFTYKQLETNTVWYQVVSTIAFLTGSYLLAQIKVTYKVLGWLLYIAGHATYGWSLYLNSALIVFGFQMASIIVAIYAIYRELIYSKVS